MFVSGGRPTLFRLTTQGVTGIKDTKDNGTFLDTKDEGRKQIRDLLVFMNIDGWLEEDLCLKS